MSSEYYQYIDVEEMRPTLEMIVNFFKRCTDAIGVYNETIHPQ